MTTRRTLRGAAPGRAGYRTLEDGPGEAHVVRTDLAPAPQQLGQPLLTLAHLSDIHVCDAQSPARVEFLDRWADPDSPLRERIEELGTYRAQELLSAQVAEAMVQAVNAVDSGPVAGGRPEFAIATGDNIDNAQANELAWYLALLEGGRVQPDSGDLGRYEGVSDGACFDERFWHPDIGEDIPCKNWGFPLVPGLLDVARRPFDAVGLRIPWLAVHGNHDRLLQGVVPGGGWLARTAVSGRKVVELPPGLDAEAAFGLIAGIAYCDPDALALLARSRTRSVTPDPARRVFGREEFLAAHFSARARPPGHGFGADGRPYYRRDHGDVRLLVLDTVDEYGSWQGSLDEDQFAWLGGELELADAERRYVVLASHHPLDTLVNEITVPGERRILAAELAGLLAAHPSVVLWLNGHTHQTAAVPHGTWWELTAPSLIDWPQQGRIVELLRGDGTLTIAGTMLDHAGRWDSDRWDLDGDDPLSLAGLSRELSANDWQWRQFPLEAHPRAGRPEDRNVLLHLRDPWA